ncbi:CASP-like protein 4A3 isoform X2 [Olea europaea var. sylvestris]|uniref:CASP-like protein 4A3 isoform X2 n=1 Tax=Olea europaea var. sylvestris TaxID=158386 RepID=UPI000C1D0DE9|nr:CASP-like protein 4A3 isoform X2 [Olea europaea var. sylvestris]
MENLRRSGNSHISMSDTESQGNQVDSFHSPLRSDSLLHSEGPDFYPENDINYKSRYSCKIALANCKALVPVDNYYSPLPSLGQSIFPSSSPANGGNGRQPEPQLEMPTPENIDFWASSPTTGCKVERPFSPSMTENHEFSVKGEQGPTSVVTFNRSGREEPVTKIGPVGGGGEDEGGERPSRAAVASILRRSKRKVTVKKAALGFRVCEVIVCLISFSVMAADRTRGWSGDSFDRYKEYRYCVAVNAIGFGYSGFQAYDLTYHLVSGKHVISPHLRYHFDFSMDQHNFHGGVAATPKVRRRFWHIL